MTNRITGPYHDEADKVYPVPERVRVLDEVHDVRPALQGDDQEYRHPGQADVVEADGSVKWVGGTDGAAGVVLVPVHALTITIITSHHHLLHCQSAHLTFLLIAGNIRTREKWVVVCEQPP